MGQGGSLVTPAQSWLIRAWIRSGVLVLEHRVQVFADARQVEQPNAMFIALPAHRNGFDLPFGQEVVEGATLDPEQALDILPPAELGDRFGAAHVGLRIDWLGGHRSHIVSRCCHLLFCRHLPERNPPAKPANFLFFVP